MSVLSAPSRYLAYNVLKSVHQGAYADIALDRMLVEADPNLADRRLITELVYGCVRRQRTLDALIDRLGKKPADQQPPNLRLVLHLGLYQLRYLSHIPPSAAVDTAVTLARQVGLTRLSGVVNGLLRQYLRLQAAGQDPLKLAEIVDPVQSLGIQHSYPDWVVKIWLDQFGQAETTALCQWLNQPPTFDLRVNSLRASLDQVEAALTEAGFQPQRLPRVPMALRLSAVGSVTQLPGFSQGWWMVQDASAQMASLLVDPQPGEVVVDACAAPGGKTLHLAELMGDRGTVWACDRSAARLKRLKANAERLQIRSIQTWVGDSCTWTQLAGQADRVLVDAPCSGLGTLHRHADARWRQTPETITELVRLQQNLLDQAATWLKPEGTLVYATCTLNPAENQAIVQNFLDHHPGWQVVSPAENTAIAPLAEAPGWLTILPHRHQQDGFFMARLRQRV